MRFTKACVVSAVAALLVGAIGGCDILTQSDTPSAPPDQNPPSETRSFYLGFTPWPYRADADFSEILFTYDLIQDYGDIVAHHFQQGIPYPEAYAMRANPVATGLPGYDADDSDGIDHSLVYGEIDLRIGQTDAIDRLYVAIDTTSTARDDLIGYFGVDYDSNGSTEQQARPNNSGGSPQVDGYGTIDWSSMTFADQEVADAFVSYARALIDRFTGQGFEVAYFNYASEISDLLLQDSAEYAQFLTFAQRVYTALKAAYPSLPLMVSVALKEPGSADASTIASGLGNLMDYVDVLGISVYPYAFFQSGISDVSDLPSTWASQVTTISGDKPVAFTETGWIAEDLSIPAYSLARSGSEAGQRAFVNELFAEAQELDAAFIIWFSLVDYSHYWSNTLGSDNVSAIWRDTGFLDYDGITDLDLAFDFDAIAASTLASAGLTERSAFTVWNEWLQIQRAPE